MWRSFGRSENGEQMTGERASGKLTANAESMPPHPQDASPEAGPANGCLAAFPGHWQSCIAVSKEEAMPRQKSLLTVIRDLVQQEVRSAMQSLLGSVSTARRAKNGRRRRRRRRGPGRPRGSKNKAA
jgi:hypothetical protein